MPSPRPPTTHFPRYWTKIDSAGQRSWSKAHLRSIGSSKSSGNSFRTRPQGILLLPDYSSTCPSKEAAYCGALHCITLADYTFPPHTKLFLRENSKALGPTPWKGASRAVWVDELLNAMPSEVDIARISAVGFRYCYRYEEDADLMMAICNPKFRNQLNDDAFSTILAQHLDKDCNCQ